MSAHLIQAYALYSYKDLYTALVLAVEAGHEDVVKPLCDHGVKTKIQKQLFVKDIQKLYWNKSNTFTFVNIPNKVKLLSNFIYYEIILVPVKTYSLVKPP